MSTKLVLDNAFFLSALQGLNDIRLTFEHKVDSSPITIANYSKQSIGNRKAVDKVTVSVKYGDSKEYTAVIQSWMPARDNSKIGANEFKGEVPMTSSSGSGDYWQLLANKTVSKIAHMESAAMIGYLVDQLYTGDCLSGESAIKAHMLDHMLKACKVTSLMVKIQVTTKHEGYIFSLANVKALLTAVAPRVKAVLSLPDKKDSAKQAHKRMVKTDVESIPEEFSL